MRAVGATQDIADGLDQTANGPQRYPGTRPQQPAAARLDHVTRDRFDDIAHDRGQGVEYRIDRRRALGLFAESGENRRAEDEEGEDRQHRQIGEIAGVDEAVVIRSHQRALGDFPRAGTGSDLQFDAAAQIAGFPAPLLG